MFQLGDAAFLKTVNFVLICAFNFISIKKKRWYFESVNYLNSVFIVLDESSQKLIYTTTTLYYYEQLCVGKSIPVYMYLNLCGGAANKPNKGHVYLF